MNSKQFRILIQMLEAIRGTAIGLCEAYLRSSSSAEFQTISHDHQSTSLIEAANSLAVDAVKDAEALEASEYFQEKHCNEHC